MVQSIDLWNSHSTKGGDVLQQEEREGTKARNTEETIESGEAAIKQFKL